MRGSRAARLGIAVLLGACCALPSRLEAQSRLRIAITPVLVEHYLEDVEGLAGYLIAEFLTSRA